jgi:S1-C subfamily serine protease
VPYIVAIVVLVFGIWPHAAASAERQSDIGAAYQTCKTDAETGDWRCQNDPELINQHVRGVAKNATEAAPTAARAWTRRSPEPDEDMAPPRRSARRSPGVERLTSGGSGFIISRSGDVLTNYHVVEGCRELHVLHHDKRLVATLVAADPTADLAVLHLPEPAADAALLRGEIPVKPGEAVVVVGFPLQGLLSSQASVTAAIVSRLSGPRDDTHQLQITAPVQPGNSGSPLLDANGAVAGVVVAKLNGLRIVKRTGTLPENVNFALNARYARALLDRIGVPYHTAASGEMLSIPAIAERALKFTVVVQCFK